MSIPVIRICGFLIVFILVSPVHALALNAREYIPKQKKLIRAFFLSGQYFECIAETRRLMIALPESYIEEYTSFIHLNYFLGGQYRTVIEQLEETERVNHRFPELILLSHSYMQLGRSREALSVLAPWSYESCLTQRRMRDLFFGRMEAHLREEQYDEAIQEIRRFRPFSADQSMTVQMEQDIAAYRERGMKSEWASVFFSSVLPGSGQLYAGRFRDAAITLAAILACSYGAYFYHERGNENISLTLAFFSALFYGGNLYGAYNSAVHANRSIAEDFREGISERYIPPYDPSVYIDTDTLLE